MKSTKNLLMAVTLGSIITITGCTAQKTQSPASGESTKAAAVEKQPASIDDASQNMRNLLKDMKAQLVNKEDAKVSEDGTKLEEAWKQFEDTVKEKNPTLYEKVEGPLGTIEAGVKVKPIDSKTIATATEALDKVLTEIQNLK